MANLPNRTLATVLAGALVLGLLLAIGTPLLSAPDELYHWQRAVQISDGHLFARKADDGQWGGKIDNKAFAFQIWFLQKFIAQEPIKVADAWDEAHNLAGQPAQRVLKPFPSTASFAPVAYLPQAIGIGISRVVGANVFTQIVCGRIFNLCAYLCLVGATFRVLIGGRYVFLAAALVPTALHLAASLSADPLNFAIPALLVATCLRCRFDPSFTLTPWRRGLITVLVVITGLLKLPYFIFGAALFLIPSSSFDNSRNRWLLLPVP